MGSANVMPVRKVKATKEGVRCWRAQLRVDDPRSDSGPFAGELDAAVFKTEAPARRWAERALLTRRVPPRRFASAASLYVALQEGLLQLQTVRSTQGRPYEREHFEPDYSEGAAYDAYLTVEWEDRNAVPPHPVAGPPADDE